MCFLATGQQQPLIANSWSLITIKNIDIKGSAHAGGILQTGSVQWMSLICPTQIQDDLCERRLLSIDCFSWNTNCCILSR